MRIPLVDLAAQWSEVEDEVRAGWERVLADTDYIGGAAIREFESAYASFIGVAHCIGVGNGTDAIELALRAAGVGRGDDVILPANTFVATAEAVVRAGATPVVVDVDPVHLLIDPDRVAEAITRRTKAIIPVDLFGQTAPLEALVPLAQQCGAVIVEDAAQAQGARRFGGAAGSLGTLSATSFYPGKNLGAAGDAGAVLTDDPELARRVRLLANHGSIEKYRHEVLGFNSRMDSLQAVVLSAKLRRLADWNAARARAATRYADLLADAWDVHPLEPAPGNEDVWHLYVVQILHRDRVLNALRGAGVDAGIHYPDPIHLTPPFRHLAGGRGPFPVAVQASRRILSLPIHPHISEEDQQFVIDNLLHGLRHVRN